METSNSARPGCGCGNKADRYVSFNDIDCAGNARRLMECIERNVPQAARTAPFWPYFMGKRQAKSGPAPDDLFLIHCHINVIRELFDECGDSEAQALLTQVEEECC